MRKIVMESDLAFDLAVAYLHKIRFVAIPRDVAVDAVVAICATSLGPPEAIAES